MVSLNQDLIDRIVLEDYKSIDAYDQITVGQEFIIDPSMIQKPPENFYIWAWADIRITLVCISSEGSITGMIQKNNALIGCSN